MSSFTPFQRLATRTPIKIPGKRKPGNQSGRSWPQNTDAPQDGVTNPPRQRRRGRPPGSSKKKCSRPSSSVLPTGKRPRRGETAAPKPQAQASYHVSKPSRLSRLEALPNEILQHVFLLDPMNVSLPRASVYIGRALSSQHIYSTVLTWTLQAAWCREFDPKALALLGNPQNPLSELSDLELASYASTVLECRWVTLERVMQAVYQPALLSWGRTTKMMEFEYSQQREEFEQDYDSWTEHGSSEYWNEELAMDHLVPLWNLCLKGCYAILPRDTLVPDRVLRQLAECAGGPAHEESKKLLYWLARAGAKIDFLRSTNGETAARAHSAAVQRGDRALEYLLKLLMNGGA